MTDQQKLQEIATLVARWQAGGISEAAAMIVIADLVGTQAISVDVDKFRRDKEQAIQNRQDYDQWRRW